MKRLVALGAILGALNGAVPWFAALSSVSYAQEEPAPKPEPAPEPAPKPEIRGF